MKTTIFLILTMLVFAACTTEQAQEQQTNEPITIGFIGPLTGELSSIGQNIRESLVLGAREINAAGGINGKTLEIIYEDGKCTGKESSKAANKLLNIDQVDVLIGTCSPEVLAAAPMAENAKIPIVSGCASNPGITDAGDYTFRTYPSDAYQGKVAAEYTYNNLGITKAAIFSCLGDWCEGLNQVFRATFEGLGGTIVAEEKFEMSARDLRGQLTKLKEAEPELIYFLGFTEASIVGVTQAKELGLEVPMLGGDAWDDADIWSAVGDAGEGAKYAAPYAAVADTYKNSMKEQIGSDEITVCSPQSYDALNVIAQVIAKVGTDGEMIKNELYNVQGFEGVSGVISFDENGDLKGGKYEIKIIENGERTTETLI